MACTLDMAWLPRWPLPLAAALLLVPVLRRGSRRLVLLALAAVALAAAARLQSAVEAARQGGPDERAGRSLAAVQARHASLVADLQRAASRAAALPDAHPALAGDRAALTRLFSALQVIADEDGSLAVAIEADPRTPLAWAGPASALTAFPPESPRRPDVFVRAGRVSTTMVATVPLANVPAGDAPFAVAERVVAMRRNIRNEYLHDFDLLAGAHPSVEIAYDAREDDGPGTEAAQGGGGRTALLTAPDGDLLALARVIPRDDAARMTPSPGLPLALGGVAAMVFALWAAAPAPRFRLLRIAGAATVARLLLAAMAPAWPAGSLTSPDAYASPLLGPLLRSPLDLFLTAAWLVTLAGVVAAAAARRAPAVPSLARGVAADVATLPVLAGIFAWVADTVVNCPLPLESVPLVPARAAPAVVQLGIALILAAGALLLFALHVPAGPLPTHPRRRAARLAAAVVVGALALQFWPRRALGLPLTSALALYLASVIFAGTLRSWGPRLRGAAPGGRAGVALATVLVLGLALYPALAHYGEKTARLQIERIHAPLVLRQPQWREYVLQETRRRIDGLQVLEEAPPGPQPPGLEELAFAVWSATDLAAFGFSSAVEIQDVEGTIVSRFALNLPSLSEARRPLPPSDQWEVTREDVALASASRRVLHARRLLSYHDEVHGAIHVYVGDDYWNLPFVTARDPYSVLFRTSGPAAGRERPVELLVYEGGPRLLFSSTEHPPSLDGALQARLRESPRGLWTTLPAGGRDHHTYLFTDGSAIYGLAYPRLGAGRYAADLVEAAVALALAAAAVLVLVMLVRTAVGRASLSLPALGNAVARRFALRLFVTFVLLAFLPAAVLQVVVRSFVADRLRTEAEDQARDLAQVGQRAVEDWAFFQRDEAPGDAPVSDPALVYVATLIRNDLDVFQRGRLLASSKRELYASGLLPPRVSGAVFRALALEARPDVVRTERIGGFSYLVVSVPVRLQGPDPGILSIPLALRQQEVEGTLEDLDRAMRLASVLFLAVAAVVAQSMARRVSGPLRELTAATERVARGDLEARVTTTSRDELRALVESFNRMAGDLGRQRSDLERSNRLAAWAEMARQVAHEVKNPLTPIQLSAEHLRRVYGDAGVDFGATLAVCTETILKQVRTLRGMVTEFTAFARPPGRVLEPQDVSSIVRDVVGPYESALPPGVSLHVEAGNGVPRVPGDRRLLERAVVNLVENALQAVGERGTIVVRVRAEDGRVAVEVEDDGPGVDPETRERVFEPFFSTKTTGSGLGLALVRKIAEDHGGGAALDSAPGGPTRAVLWLPADGAPPQAAGD